MYDRTSNLLILNGCKQAISLIIKNVHSLFIAKKFGPDTRAVVIFRIKFAR